MTSPIAKIGILSTGEMGIGIAKLLIANGFSVATNCKGRSNNTIERAKNAKVEIYKSDEHLAEACDVILSVVPPRDATATAQRIVDAVTGPFRRSEGSEPLYFADLNAVAPSTIKSIATLFEQTQTRGQVRFIDGAIIGGPPAPKQQPSDAPTSESSSNPSTADWSVPSIPTSGPYKISKIPRYGEKLSTTLNVRHISDEIGAASGLKMCFASLTKGFTSLAIQSFTTAKRLGVLDELQNEVQGLIPAHWRAAERGVIGMAPKAYRWVREMEEIALTFKEEGGFPQDLYRGVADVYRAVAEDTVLGQEKVGRRKRGLDVNDMATAMAEGLEKKKKKND
ncbi:6-phosphogluconate dehydrogenase C-terminal domain-like protein [Xylariaceae sp. AK1471]|nr:6-phosphogluconate dehydrogenase C-terminal domain-like protein [Xylariaceae sp. AK1471]